jgi:hypothetical protein
LSSEFHKHSFSTKNRKIWHKNLWQQKGAPPEKSIANQMIIDTKEVPLNFSFTPWEKKLLPLFFLILGRKEGGGSGVSFQRDCFRTRLEHFLFYYQDNKFVQHISIELYKSASQSNSHFTHIIIENQVRATSRQLI